MNLPPSRWDAICPKCGATHPATATSCWLCGGAVELVVAARAVELPARTAVPSPVPGGHRGPVQFGLASLMLAVTWVAVVCGVSAIHPGLGVALCIVSAPALIRTCLVVNVRKERGLPVSALQKAGMYLGSVFVTSVILGFIHLVLVAAAFGFVISICSTDANVKSVSATVTMFMLPVMVSGILLSVLWVRYRWRKAVGEPGRRPPRGR